MTTVNNEELRQLIIDSPGLTAPEIAKRVGASAKEVFAWLEQWHDAGFLTRGGSGKVDDQYRWFWDENIPARPPEPETPSTEEPGTEAQEGTDADNVTEIRRQERGSSDATKARRAHVEKMLELYQRRKESGNKEAAVEPSILCDFCGQFSQPGQIDPALIITSPITGAGVCNNCVHSMVQIMNDTLRGNLAELTQYRNLYAKEHGEAHETEQ